MSDHSARVPAVVARCYPDVAAHPIVAQEYVPGRGWVSQRRYRKRVTVSWCRRLRGQGVTVVALDVGGRLADFAVAEIIQGGTA